MKHILFTLRGCDADLLNDNHYIRSGLVSAARETGSKVLDWSTHCFEPQGVTFPENAHWPSPLKIEKCHAPKI